MWDQRKSGSGIREFGTFGIMIGCLQVDIERATESLKVENNFM